MIKTKKIDPTIEIMNDCLLIDKEILVLGDFHMGYEDILAGKGVFPRTQLKTTIEKLNDIFWNLNLKAVRLKQIIICGDLKHEFWEISDAEWRETTKILDYLVDKCKDIILIRGNHDKILGPITGKRGVKLKEYYKIKGICFLHGHELYENCLGGVDILIMAHLHPAISISDEYKYEKYKCFLRGKWKRKRVYILPSFSEVNIGYDLIRKDDKIRNKKNKKDFLIIPEDKLKNFEIIIYNNKEKTEYNFGKLKKLAK